MIDFLVHGEFFDAYGLGWQKAGEDVADMEDAANAEPVGRFALADGASESTYAGMWAKILVVGYASGVLEGPDDLTKLTSLWEARVATAPTRVWYVDEKLHEGAFSTLCGLSCMGDGRWQALAVGDTCLFHVRDSAVVATFPAHSGSALRQAPTLVGTRPLYSTVDWLRTHGTWGEGDVFLLCTDALARMIFDELESGTMGYLALMEMQTAGEFRHWLDHARIRGRLANDDTTLLRVHLRKPRP